MPLAASRVLPTGISMYPFGNYSTGGSGHLVRFNVSQFGNPYTTFASWFVPRAWGDRILFGMNLYDIWFSCGGVGVNTGCADVYGPSYSFSTQPYLLAVSMPNTYPNSAYPPVIWLNGTRTTPSQLCGSPCSRSVNNPVRLGGWTINDLYNLDGVIAHFFVWNRQLSDTEVQRLYSCGWRDPCPPANGLIHWIGPDGVDRVGNAPVLISNARARWHNANTLDGMVYAEIYSGATTNSKPPSADYTFVTSTLLPIDLAWFSGCWYWPPSTYYEIFNIFYDWRGDMMPYWFIRLSGRSTYIALIYDFMIYLPQSGTYTIEWISDDGFALYIDGNLVIDNWVYQGPALKSQTASLSAGWHRFTVKWFEGGGAWVLLMGLVMPDGTPVRPLLPVYGIRIRAPTTQSPLTYASPVGAPARTFQYKPTRLLSPTR
ncbi:PA14 domain-containing protein [Pyrobaculum sp.]|uniref:PA14 domain-containing protein n=1 Tax=Pyrobaculum sp. TaxID=2004705 RepID=UPI003D0D6691